METLNRLSIAISRMSITVMIVSTIAVYALHLGEWTLLGTRVYDFLVFSTLIALLNAFLDDLIIAPGLSSQVAKLAKQTIMLTDDGSVPAGQVSFANEVIDAMDKREKLSRRLSAVIGAVSYFVLGPRIGSPASEFISLAMLILLPLLLLILMGRPLMRLQALEPAIYEAAGSLYSSIHMKMTNGTMK